MYKSKTTFVIGAGASLELGFPTSATLKSQIASAVDIRFEHFNTQISGDRSIAEGLKRLYDYTKSDQISKYNEHLNAGWHISKAMPQSISIDNFVENQENGSVTFMAKMAIASCLIDAESSCLKKFKIRDEVDSINWTLFQENWIHSFFQTLTEGTRKSSVSKIFNNLTFIVFNYDRSLEYFLAHSLHNYYQIEYQEACQIVASANFIHPYGQIGALEWQRSTLPTLAFGSGRKDNIHVVSESILTFSEQLEDEDRLSALRESIAEADQLVFLGFAFHDSNMQLLQPERTYDTLRVVGTAYGVSEPDSQVILDQLAKLCLLDETHQNFHGSDIGLIDMRSEEFILDRNSTCKSLFETYRRTLIA